MPSPYRSLLLTILPLLGCPTPVGDKDTGDTGDTGDTADTGDTGDTAETGDTARAPVSESGCYSFDASLDACPAPEDVPPDRVTPDTCGAEVLSVDGPGTPDESCAYIGGFAPMAHCRYPITVIPPEEECAYGRPLVLGGRPRLAPLARATGWAPGAAAPDATAPVRAATWARVALAEHASVASFGRFALELLAFGAPADLVAAAHQAALDEVRHAKLAFALASAHAGDTLAPGPLPLADLAVCADLVAFAAATAREGCVAETLSALQMAEARDRATDPAEHAALVVIARDEARHAALAWRTVRWAIEAGGEEVRAAVTRALAEVPTGAASALLPPDVARATVLRGWREVIGPAAAALAATPADEAHASA